ncbi:MAG: hypothetical protein R3272_08290 [Candidatus Promineifilaceae bacterium]|nr:hypothetical protein [Candidatus Promineifilaceae bacterium]
MPPLTRWYVRTALLYLFAALVLGVLRAARVIWQIPGAGVDALYLHLFMVGWITQFIFGFAYWMFPVFSREAPRRSPRLGRVVYVLLNGAILLRALALPVRSLSEGVDWQWVELLSTALLLVACLLFVVNTWGRVRGR